MQTQLKKGKKKEKKEKKFKNLLRLKRITIGLCYHSKFERPIPSFSWGQSLILNSAYLHVHLFKDDTTFIIGPIYLVTRKHQTNHLNTMMRRSAFFDLNVVYIVETLEKYCTAETLEDLQWHHYDAFSDRPSQNVADPHFLQFLPTILLPFARSP